ncbi:MAG: ATP-binding protein [Magnetococcus sp. DMHC-8]
MGRILHTLKNITFIRKLYYLIILLCVKLLIVLGTVAWVFWLTQQEADREQTVDQLAEWTWSMLAQLHDLNGHVQQYALFRGANHATWVKQHMPGTEQTFARLTQGQVSPDQAATAHLQADFHQYANLVAQLFQQLERYGVDQEQGVQGEMRVAIHRAEVLLATHPVWNGHLLNIRRAEKDFMLRLDDRYVIALHQQVDGLLTEVTGSQHADRAEMGQRLLEYREKFQELAQLTLAVRDTTRAIHTLWDDMVEDMTALRTAMQTMREAEHRRYEQATRHLALGLIVGVLLVFVLVGALLSAIFYGNILKPIRLLTQRAHAIANGQYDCDISLSGRDEIGVLATHLQRMKESLQQANRTLEQQIDQRTRSLSLANTELQRSMQQLERTRDELIQSEKVASLGRLVAGFAHEINTPIGVGVGSISALPEYVIRLETLLAADEVDGDQLDEVMAKIREMSSLCLHNLRSVADLVARFKRTSVDQTSEQPRRFNVHELLLDVTTTLHHLFKRSAVEIVLHCPADIVVRSQPGALGQVLTNLLLNSYRHGFDEGQRTGTIEINVQFESEHDKLLVIWYADNGRGIAPKVLKHVFEPFFTTARGRGGTGLGLYLCYNMVRSQLGGKIVCSSIPGQMTSFLLEIPVTGEGNDQENST